ncbi:MAG: cysteine peptidase family C39 domain-containing protein [Isosphaeraceae bacterium]
MINLFLTDMGFVVVSICSLLIALLSQIPDSGTTTNRVSSDNIFAKNACGPISLATVALYFGREDTLDEIFGLLPPTGEPRTLENIRSVATRLGFQTRALRWHRGAFPVVSCPAIIRLDPLDDGFLGHFVVLMPSSRGRVQILDSPDRPYLLSPEQLWKRWDGVALHVGTSSDQLPEPLSVPLLPIGLATFAFGIATLGLVTSRQRPPRGKPSAGADNRPLVSGMRHPAPWVVLSAVSLACVTGLTVNPLAPGTPEAPSLEIAPRLAEVNATPGGESVSVKYMISNNTRSVVRLEAVESSCGCARPRLSAERILPGASIELVVDVKPSAVIGSRPFSIWVSFADPELDPLELPGIVHTK